MCNSFKYKLFFNTIQIGQINIRNKILFIVKIFLLLVQSHAIWISTPTFWEWDKILESVMSSSIIKYFTSITIKSSKRGHGVSIWSCILSLLLWDIFFKTEILLSAFSTSEKDDTWHFHCQNIQTKINRIIYNCNIAYKNIAVIFLLMNFFVYFMISAQAFLSAKILRDS